MIRRSLTAVYILRSRTFISKRTLSDLTRRCLFDECCSSEEARNKTRTLPNRYYLNNANWQRRECSREFCTNASAAEVIISAAEHEAQNTIWDSASTFDQSSQEMDDCKVSLELQNISNETLRKYGVKFHLCRDDDNTNASLPALIFPWYDQTDSDRPTGQLILLRNGETRRLYHRESGAVFGLNLLNNQLGPKVSEIIVAETEEQALALHELTGHVAIVLPDKLDKLQKQTSDYLKSLDRIIFWYSADRRRLATKQSRYLRVTKCFIIETNLPSAVTLLNDNANKSSNERRGAAEAILKACRPIVASNIMPMTAFFSDMMNDLYGTEGTVGVAEWKRFKVLNSYLRGLRLGELTVVTGPTGSGKTTFLSEYSIDLAEQDVSTLWCNFELKNSRLCAVMVRQYYGGQKANFDIKSITPPQMARLIQEMHEKLPLYFANFNGATKVDKVIKAIIDQVTFSGVQHVIIDNLQFMLGGGSNTDSSNRFFIQDAVYSQFRKLATDLNVHITMVIHPRKFAQSDIDQELSIHSLYGGAKAAQEADNVLLIQMNRNFGKYLQIAKNRYFGDVYVGNRLLMKFDPLTRRHTLTWRPFPQSTGDKKRTFRKTASEDS